MTAVNERNLKVNPSVPPGHSHALAAEVPGARLIAMERTGHEVFPRTRWDIVIRAILEHTTRHRISGERQ
ncbi:alpha/beta fold hydrolase [Rhizohabitans arisaemae]|uniref:alpha/beta fold hydrolase n=1 Tax=Rhizohabitans arisaemae TaxID=2720610 RepID=UPI0024B0B673|nr:hypothetical protein [Rhizohabitans arisaemae]